MRIETVKISGYRSVPYCVALTNDDEGKLVGVDWGQGNFVLNLQPDSKGHDIIGLVGPNSSGKSNILRALRLFFTTFDSDDKEKPSPDIDYHMYSPGNETDENGPQIVVEIGFSSLSEEERLFLSKYCVTSYASGLEKSCELIIGVVWDTMGGSRVYCRPVTGGSAVTELGTKLTQVDVKKVASMMPRFYWLPTGEDVTKELQVRGGGRYLKKLVDSVMQDIKDLEAKEEIALDANERNFTEQIAKVRGEMNDLKQELDRLQAMPSPLNSLATSIVNYMKPIMAEVEAWFEYSSNLPSDFWGWLDVSTMRFDDGWPSNISEKGHGAQRTFALALLQAYADFRMRKTGPHPIVIAIEEPEIYMHPHVGRVMASTLFRLSKNGQVIFSTHSPSLIHPLEWENLALVRSVNHTTTVKQLPPDSLSNADREQIRKNLDAAECEMFLSRETLLVEGPTERFALPGIVETIRRSEHPLYMNLDELGVSVIDVGGSDKFEPFVRLLSLFGIRWSVLADNDALASLIGQLDRCGLIPADVQESLHGLSDDFEARRGELLKLDCYILGHDFEGTLAAALSDERLWEIINKARELQDKIPITPLPYPGDQETQVSWQVDRWLDLIWDRLIRPDIAPEHREIYENHVISLASKLQPELSELATNIVADNHWRTNTREKWYADRLAGQAKPTVGLVVGELLDASEILSIDGLESVLGHLVSLQGKSSA